MLDIKMKKLCAEYIHKFVLSDESVVAAAIGVVVVCCCTSVVVL